jgi:hypothetical protein
MHNEFESQRLVVSTIIVGRYNYSNREYVLEIPRNHHTLVSININTIIRKSFGIIIY